MISSIKGKTTTAQLVCKALDMPFIELNASDNRSQRTIEAIDVHSAYLTGPSQTKTKHVRLDEVSIEELHRSRRFSFQVLIMDEVDGISGSEGRGGMQTLLQLFRTTRIPIICIANDRQASKMRTLISNCYEIKFDRPSFLNVKSYLLDICSREHIRITHGSLDNLIHVHNRDVRHLIHTLNLFYKQSSSMLTSMTKTEKVLSTSPMDACMKMFAMAHTSLLDKASLYFHDSSLMPLLIHDNYLRVVPSLTAQRKPVSVSQRLDLISKVADSLLLGDLCSMLNHTNGSRALMSYEVNELHAF